MLSSEGGRHGEKGRRFGVYSDKADHAGGLQEEEMHTERVESMVAAACMEWVEAWHDAGPPKKHIGAPLDGDNEHMVDLVLWGAGHTPVQKQQRGKQEGDWK